MSFLLKIKTAPVLPEKCFLASIENWCYFDFLKAEKTKIKVLPNTLVISCLDTESAKKLELLRKGLKQKAQTILLPWLRQLSTELNLPYASAGVRDQKARWGSCSAQKNILLNYKLIFLPPKLVQHIMIHELCHTIHFDHSKRFWQSVASFDADFKENRQQTKMAQGYIPNWLG